MKRVTPTIIEIDLEALRFNFRQLKKRLPPNARSLCVVKSNAYGHGAPRIAKALQEEGAEFFGTGTVDEGVELRESSIKRPILILLGICDDHFEALARYQLTPVLYDIKTAEALNSYVLHSHKKLQVHVKVDTGMTRLGVMPADFTTFCRRMKSFTALQPVGLLTHLAEAGDESFTAKQFKEFCKARETFEEIFPPGNDVRYYHIANSQAIVDGKIEQGAGTKEIIWLARMGIALYGAYPLERDRKLIELKPVLQWKSRLVAIKEVPPRTPVSYNRIFVTKRSSRIGILPVGYADGYPRILSNKSRVLVRGKPAPVAGTICMDLMMIDLTEVSEARVGDEVVLLGRQGKSEIWAEELAKQAQTISYEIFCGISGRVPRLYR